MPKTCSVYKCHNRSAKDSTISFHCFPRSELKREQWMRNIGRYHETGKPWMPTQNARVCSEHFTPDDFDNSKSYKILKPEAVPTVFKDCQPHKQCQIFEVCRSSPRNMMKTVGTSTDQSTKSQKFDHTYVNASMESELARTRKKLEEVTVKLKIREQEIKNLNKKLDRRENKISTLRDNLVKQQVLHRKQLDLMKLNLGGDTYTVVEIKHAE